VARKRLRYAADYRRIEIAKSDRSGFGRLCGPAFFPESGLAYVRISAILVQKLLARKPVRGMLCAPIPGHLELTCPYTDARVVSGLLISAVGAMPIIFPKIDSPSASDHFPAQIGLRRRPADRHRPAVSVSADHVARDLIPVDQIDHRLRRQLAAHNLSPARVETRLVRLGRIDVGDPNMSASDHQRVAIDHASRTRDDRMSRHGVRARHGWQSKK
jgi:hypothetical protein